MKPILLKDLMLDDGSGRVDVTKIPEEYRAIEDLKFVWSDEYQDHMLDVAWFHEELAKETDTADHE